MSLVKNVLNRKIYTFHLKEGWSVVSESVIIAT